jgi:hypothetical protein
MGTMPGGSAEGTLGLGSECHLVDMAALAAGWDGPVDVRDPSYVQFDKACPLLAGKSFDEIRSMSHKYRKINEWKPH